MREKGGQDRIVWPGEEKPPDPTAAGAAQAPLTLPLNRWRQEGLAWAEGHDWSVSYAAVSSLCLRSHLGCSHLVVLEEMLTSIILSLSKVITSALLILLNYTFSTQSADIWLSFPFFTYLMVLYVEASLGKRSWKWKIPTRILKLLGSSPASNPVISSTSTRHTFA